MDALVRLKMEASAYPIHLHTHDEKTAYVQHTKETEGVNLNVERIKKTPGRHVVVNFAQQSLW